MTGGHHRSAFDRGRTAGLGGSEAANPYPAGTPDHRNYALGWAFGAGGAAERRDFATARPEASTPGRDETDD